MSDGAVSTQRPPLTVPVFALLFLGLVAHAPATIRAPLVGRTFVVLAGAAIGIPLLVRAARRGDGQARLASAFLAWSLVSAVTAGTWLAWTGAFFSLTGALFTLALGAFWMIGRSLPVDVRPVVGSAVLAGACVNAAVALLQGVTSLEAYDISLYDERATGLLGNPVFLGTLCASALALLDPLVRRIPALGAAAALLLAAATQLSGTRNALVVLVVTGAWVAVRSGWTGGVLVAGAVVAGLVLGSALQLQTDTSATARLQDPSGIARRVENWREGAVALADRPAVGYGPGRWAEAVTPRRTLDVARGQPDRLYEDAHNIIVEHVVTTGVVGGVLFVLWLAVIVRGLRRPDDAALVVAAAGLFVNHLVEPQHLVLTPLMFLLAGAAARRLEPTVAPPGLRAAQGALVVAALAVASVQLLGDVTYRRADLSFDVSEARRAAGLLRPWARPVTVEARIHLFLTRAEKEPGELVLALDAARRARSREPWDPSQWIAVAAIEGQLGRHTAAARTYAGALERNPWSARALSGRGDELRFLGRTTQATACRVASRAADHSDAELVRARDDCLRPDAKRERP